MVRMLGRFGCVEIFQYVSLVQPDTDSAIQYNNTLCVSGVYLFVKVPILLSWKTHGGISITELSVVVLIALVVPDTTKRLLTIVIHCY